MDKAELCSLCPRDPADPDGNGWCMSGGKCEMQMQNAKNLCFLKGKFSRKIFCGNVIYIVHPLLCCKNVFVFLFKR